MGEVLCVFEHRKRLAIGKEDYDEAKKWKVLVLVIEFLRINWTVTCTCMFSFLFICVMHTCV